MAQAAFGGSLRFLSPGEMSVEQESAIVFKFFSAGLFCKSCVRITVVV